MKPSLLFKKQKEKIKHSKTPKTKWVRLNCVYKIKIKDQIVHVGRSDTCKKHGGAEKVRKAIVNLLNLTDDNTSVPKTKYWEEIRLRYRPNSTNIKMDIVIEQVAEPEQSQLKEEQVASLLTTGRQIKGSAMAGLTSAARSESQKNIAEEQLKQLLLQAQRVQPRREPAAESDKLSTSPAEFGAP